MKNEMENTVEVLKNSFENRKERLEEIDKWLKEFDLQEEFVGEKEELEKELRRLKAQLVALVTKIGIFLDREMDELELRIDAEVAKDIHRHVIEEWLPKWK